MRSPTADGATLGQVRKRVRLGKAPFTDADSYAVTCPATTDEPST